MNAKWLKAQATSAKRTATVLRDFAKTYGLDPEDSGIMLAAARAVGALAVKRSDEAKRVKREEDAYAAAMARLTPEAVAKIKADWPITTTVQRVAVIALSGGRNRLNSSVEILSMPSRYVTAAASLASMVEDSIRDSAGSIAYAANRNKTTVAVEIGPFSRKLEALYLNESVKRSAEMIDALLAA